MSRVAKPGDNPPKRGNGNVWHPTDDQRQTAMMLFGLGATQLQVAKQLGISKKCVQDRLQEEFETGWELANLQLYGKLWKKAVVGGDTACLIFLAKNRLGMTDRRDLNHSGEMASPPVRAELCLRVEYRYAPAGALAPPPADRLPGHEFKGPA